MKKQIKIFIGVISLILIFGMLNAKAQYNVTIGDILKYEVQNSEWYYYADTKYSEGEGFNFNDKLFDNDEEISVTIDYAEEFRVEFTVDVDTESAEYIMTPMSLIGINFLFAFPYLMVEGLEHTIDTGESELGVGLQNIYFLEPSLSYDFFTMASDDESIASEYSNDDAMTYYSVGGDFDADDDIAIFTWHYDTRYTVWTDDTDFTGTYEFIIEYDQNTGILQRYLMDIDYTGVWGYTAVELEILQEVTIKGYNNNSGSTTIMLITTIPILTALVVFRKISGMKNN